MCEPKYHVLVNHRVIAAIKKSISKFKVSKYVYVTIRSSVLHLSKKSSSVLQYYKIIFTVCILCTKLLVVVVSKVPI